MAGLYDDVRRAQERQVALAAERFDETEKARDRNAQAREANGTGVHDSLARLQARAERLLARNETPADAIVKVQAEGTTDRRLALERIIDASNELQSWTFLPRGARVAATVARITLLDQGRELPLGTGFLVSPRLLMTNNHVLPTASAASGVVVEFGAELDIDNLPRTSSRWSLDPQTVFLTDAHLDVSLVLVAPDAQGRSAGEVFGWNRLMAQQGKIVTGEAMNVIGHPNGRLKEIAIRNNLLQLILDDFLHYSTDTEPGNSGSPLFNDQWELVGLHHAGVPAKDDQGRVLRKDGKPWQPGDGDDAIDWVANEGARISRIMAWLAEQQIDGEAAQIVAEIAGADTSPGTSPVVAPSVAGVGGTTEHVVVDLTTPLPAQAVGESSNGRQTAGRSAGLRGSSQGAAYVFLHGRSQEGKDPGRLRISWTAGLNAGLTLAERPPVRPADVWFPFYGDRLVQALATTESASPGITPADAAGSPAEALAPPPGDPARSIYEQLVTQASSAAGMPSSAVDDPAADESLAGLGLTVVGRLQRQLSWLSRRTGLDDLVIARVFADVAAYLGRPSVRTAVLDTVLETWPRDRPVVLVSHSLGTVVAMDLLHRLGNADVPLLVTAGSPLAMDAVSSRLLAGGVHKPAGVGAWLNVWCAPDAVAIGCPMTAAWGPAAGSLLTEVVTDQPSERAHYITEYLGDVRVAGRIAAAASAAADLAPV